MLRMWSQRLPRPLRRQMRVQDLSMHSGPRIFAIRSISLIAVDGSWHSWLMSTLICSAIQQWSGFQARLESLTSSMHFGMMNLPGDDSDLSYLALFTFDALKVRWTNVTVA